MRNRLFAIAAIAGAMVAPIAAQAQTAMPSCSPMTTVLPETGVTYYDVPQSFGMTPYRYTVVNGQTILVEPRSRRIVQVVD